MEKKTWLRSNWVDEVYEGIYDYALDAFADEEERLGKESRPLVNVCVMDGCLDAASKKSAKKLRSTGCVEDEDGAEGKRRGDGCE